MSTSNGRLNNSQRKALAELTDQLFQTKITDEKDKNRVIEEQIVEGIKKELKVFAMNQKMLALKEQAGKLQQQIRELGFYPDGLSFTYDRTSKAQLLLDSRMKRTGKPASIEQYRTEITAKIWMAASIEEANKIMKEVQKATKL